MLSGVNRVAGGAQASAPDKKALEAKRQEILKNAQAQGGSQARAVQTGKRQAEAAQPNRTTAAPSNAQGGGQTAGAGWQQRIKRWDAKPDEGKGAKVDVTG